MMLATCPHCNTVLWHPHEATQNSCDTCQTTRARARLEAYWSGRITQLLDIREAFAPTGNQR